MKAKFTFKGNDRPQEIRTATYPNYPLLVSLLEKVRITPIGTGYKHLALGGGVWFQGYVKNTYNKVYVVERKSTPVFGTPSGDATRKKLLAGPYNYLVGDVVTEEIQLQGKWTSNLVQTFDWQTKKEVLSDLPQNFHYFGLEVPNDPNALVQAPGSTEKKPLWTGIGEGTLHITATPNYNFYVEHLETLDHNTDYDTQKVVRNNDFYAYKSIKVLGDKVKDLTTADFAYKTWTQIKTYVDEVGDNNETVVFQREDYPNKIKSFFQNYLMQGSYSNNPNYLEQYQQQSSNSEGMKSDYYQINDTSFISQDKNLLDATNNQEKMLPLNITIETNYNMVPQNAANNEFKKLLKDSNLYETFYIQFN